MQVHGLQFRPAYDMMQIPIKDHSVNLFHKNQFHRERGDFLFRQVLSATVVGLEVCPVSVEVDVSDGLPCFTMVGYVSAQVREAQDRVRTALKNVGISMPPKRITVNLAPADIRKEGAGFDLPIAFGILSASGRIPQSALENVFFIGELGLNGEVRPVPGILPMILMAVEKKINLCVVPKANLAEAKVIKEMNCLGVQNIQELLDYFKYGVIPQEQQIMTPQIRQTYGVDFADILGQEAAKRAALVAVSGFHNMLMVGPPGSGKTMLAQRIPTILPPMTRKESLEVSKIYSVAGLLSKEQPLMGIRPFCDPHHTASPQALAGGGLVPKPGLISLSHRGCLFLDEMPEFSRKSLEILRQPLEDRTITISRTSGTYTFPAHFLLLAAMNPCPCGCYPDLNRCTCTPAEIKKYRSKISFPLLDRIDITTNVSAVSYEELQEKGTGRVTSAQLREQVERVRNIQKNRYEKEGFLFNSELPASKVETYCPMTPKAKDMMERVFQKLNLSARSYHRILRVSRTIADLDETKKIDISHISEAIYYRGTELCPEHE